MTTFHQARLKLTIWYLLIIMAISILFSLYIYKTLTAEVDRFEKAQRFFIERKLQEHLSPSIHLFNHRQQLNPELIAETKQRILLMLLAANAGILIITGGLGYFLAGRTLKPIKKMMDEQNRFITDASHELKTPLTALRSEFEVAIMDEEKLQLKEAKNLIKSGFEEIVQLQGLTENLLQLTQKENKIGILKTEQVSLLEITEAALKRVIPIAKKKHIAINNHIDDFILKADTQSITELLVILLDNAIKYSHENAEVNLTAKKIDHHIEISIQDTGIGIGKKDLPHIFDRFYRADKSRSKTPGYGLGLSIAKKIVEAHKGSIFVQSIVNKRTTFIVRLPTVKV
jgi:signal transduction histidine kinase